MTIFEATRTALTGVSTNKSRSALTILGIVIGITAIILVMSIGSGAQSLILSQIEALGSKTITIIPGREPTGPSDFAQVFSESLKEKDLTALTRRENVPTLSRVMPVVFGAETASYGNETYRPTIFGATELMFEMFDLEVDAGTAVSDEDVRGRAAVAVIGSTVAEELFGDEDPVGQKLKIKGTNFLVIGTLPSKGQVSFFNFDEMISVPYTSAQQYIFGIKHFHRLIVEADTEENVDRTVRDVKATLRESHDITDPEKDDFFVQTQADIAERVSSVTTIMTLFLVAVAGISLLVGGIGIMNIMLVSVTERTREIGLRKAIGATDKDILTQFLFEAIILTGLGGVIGILLGAFLSFMTSLALSQFAGLDWTFTFPVSAALLGLGVAGCIGLVFGLYPARKAALKSPIEALRYE